MAVGETLQSFLPSSSVKSMRNSQSGAPVFGKDGLSGILVDALPARVTPKDTVRIKLGTGKMIEVPADMLVLGSDGSYLMPIGPEDLIQPGLQSERQQEDVNDRPATTVEEVVPVLAEELVIDKKRVPTGGVRINRRLIEHDETVELPLLKEHVDVRRIVVDREVDGPLPIRREGETIVIPVVEEVLVVEKRYRLKEEIHVSRMVREELHREQVTVRRQEAEVEQFDAQGRTRSIPIESPPVRQPARRRPRKSILGEL